MKALNNGEHYGISQNVMNINGLTVINSSYYNQAACPLHYHQNAHFAFTINGRLTETHKKQKLYISPGDLMYNHSQESHSNSDYSKFVSALHIDISDSWFSKYEFKFGKIEGVHILKNPILKNLFINLYKEANLNDPYSSLTIESLMMQAMCEFMHEVTVNNSSAPAWINQLRDLLHSNTNIALTLEKVAKIINIHPVYLCQQFPVYFHSSFGDYIRKIKIEKSVSLMMVNPHNSLTDIAYESGFSDQSHFIRLFRKYVGINPLAYRKILLK
jgi:AraC family transcriptional regulator